MGQMGGSAGPSCLVSEGLARRDRSADLYRSNLAMLKRQPQRTASCCVGAHGGTASGCCSSSRNRGMDWNRLESIDGKERVTGLVGCRALPKTAKDVMSQIRRSVAISLTGRAARWSGVSPLSLRFTIAPVWRERTWASQPCLHETTSSRSNTQPTQKSSVYGARNNNKQAQCPQQRCGTAHTVPHGHTQSHHVQRAPQALATASPTQHARGSPSGGARGAVRWRRCCRLRSPRRLP